MKADMKAPKKATHPGVSRAVSAQRAGNLPISLSDCVEEVGGKIKGKQKEPLCYYFQSNPISGKISDILSMVESIVVSASKQLYPRLPAPNPESMRNLRGYWFETIVKYIAWEVSANSEHVWVIPMPNANTLEFWELFNEPVDNVLKSLFEELERKGIKLTLSNPDLLFVKRNKTSVTQYTLGDAPTSFSMHNISKIDNAFIELKDKCEFGSFPFGIAVKTALRPDRRYQIIYEGAVLKAIMSHLKQRFWDRNYEIKYYGIVNEPVTDSDAMVLTNPSIDSLTSVYVEPRKAVDEVKDCETIDSLRACIKDWVSRV